MTIGVLPSGGGGPGAESFAIVAGSQSTDLTTPTVFGVKELSLATNPSTFSVVLSAPAGLTMNVRISDLTAGGVVLGTVVSTASTSPVALSMTFAPIDATPRVYSVEGYLSGGVPTPATPGYCYSAYVEA